MTIEARELDPEVHALRRHTCVDDDTQTDARITVMKFLIAGATGAIGQPLLHCLEEAGHEAFALVCAPKAAGTLAKSTRAVVADALDAASVLDVVHHVRPDVIINELTSLPKHYTPEEMKAAAARDKEVRVKAMRTSWQLRAE